MWCNGSTHGFGPCSLGSSPSKTTMKKYLCKKDYYRNQKIVCREGKYYDCEKFIVLSHCLYSIDADDCEHYSCDDKVFFEHFCTIKEVRNQKLSSINF